MKQFLFIVSLMILLTGFNFQSVYIDPTGTYSLVNKAIKKNGDIYGYTGGIQVKKIKTNVIAMTFGVNKGAPSYNMGLFVDTLKYLNNKAVHTSLEDDSTCKIIFDFDKNGVTVTEETADVNSGCGFGHAVAADGYYRKVSGKVPVLTDPGTGEKLK
jgi:hypothetical protein